MTDLATSLSAQPRDDSQSVAVTTEPADAPTLITEQEVLIGSAAALAGPRVRSRRLLAAAQALFLRPQIAESPEKRNPPNHYPRHYTFIEYAAMSRMLDRP